MIPHETLFTFSPEEEAQYTLQVTLQQRQLLSAPDALDSYSCHSQPHVLEVMEQCHLLLDAFMPWLRTQLPGVSADWMRDQLLLAAKLHDIGMCGTESLRALLLATDRLYTLLSASGPQPQELIAPYLHTVLAEAEASRLTNRTWRDIRRWSEDVPKNEARLLRALLEYHEDVKSAIRKRHAENSGRFILSHLDALSERYGPSADLLSVAALAALHSSSSMADACIVPDGEHVDSIRRHIRTMVAQERSEPEADRITQEEPFRCVIALAALLRLADTRRSGSRLCSMDQTPIVCQVAPDGAIRLYKRSHGVPEPIPGRIAHTILASEALTEFGSVSALPVSDGTWHIRHEITLRCAGFPEIRDLFARSRLQSYAEEIDTGALVYRLGFTHEILLHLEGCPPFAGMAAVRRWREEVPWLRESPLKITVV